ncbi:G5 domain-containing protein [uncultured Bifidobacterium sp.]|uniref:aggregation-promoting factor C-terminal-like domain-containing protein n=1 Tax=uncultured Bifidobacterium sp. TaxID=165187 RepID=UPI002610B1F1|nr:G5 domain-containing protein [uncultured Bifidobacterium sp.]
MAHRWTPHHVIVTRRVRVLVCVGAVVLASVVTFMIGARKSVALTINGDTRTVTTYAMSVDRLLDEQDVDVKSHDSVTSTTGGNIDEDTVVTVRKAYQATIVIDGKSVPFWTTATSTTQLLNFFRANEKQAEKVTVNIANVYNQLTGGLVIKQDGPVTVIADGKSVTIQNGRLPAASILDAAGVTLDKNDRVNVSLQNGHTILRVQRITHRTVNEIITTPFGTQTVIDGSLSAGETVIRQKGATGTTRRTYDVTYADGVEESRTLVSSTVVSSPLDEIIAVGPSSSSSSSSQSTSGSSDEDSESSQDTSSSSSSSSSPSPTTGGTSSSSSSSSSTSTSTTSPTPTNGSPGTSTSSKPSPSPSTSTSTSNTSSPSPSSSPTSSDDNDNDNDDNGGSSAALWHPTASEAQTYAAGAAAAYGWTGTQWTDLVWIWNHESSWMWNAENSSSGAYGIPQALPASKMATFGANWHDDAAVQIAWGLNYIKQRYGSPSAARAWWKTHNWY